MRQKNLHRITLKFGRAYTRSKKYDERKKHWQQEMFEALTQDLLRDRRLPQRTIKGPTREWILQHNPGWRIIDEREDGPEGGITYVLERDPDLIDHHYINLEDGMVYRRGTVEEGPTLDEERLKAEDPELYQEIAEVQYVIKDPQTWTEAQHKRVAPYLTPGKIKAKLVPPRPAKPEELESIQ